MSFSFPFEIFGFMLFTNTISSAGEAEAILAKAKATAEGLAHVSKALKDSGGVEVGFSILLLSYTGIPLYFPRSLY